MYPTLNKKEITHRLQVSEFKVVRKKIARILSLQESELKRKRLFFPAEVRAIDQELGLNIGSTNPCS